MKIVLALLVFALTSTTNIYAQKEIKPKLNKIESLYKNPEKATQTKFRNKIESSFEWVGPIKEDIFVMSFYAWLKSKIEGTELYPTTLDLIRSSQNVN
jgi:hypothetical protein